jgi:hypothetical protein
MRHTLQTLILALILALPLGAAPETQRLSPPTETTIGTGAVVRPVPEGYRFPHGTIFRYDAEWRLWKAGTASIRVDPAGPEERVTATADATGVVAMLYRVQDQFESFFDRRTFCSLSITKRSEEGRHKRNTIIRFDQVRRKAVLDETNLRTNQSKHTEQDTPGCVTDVLSGMFYLASLPLQPGGTYLFPLNDGGKTVNVRAAVEAREEIKTPTGTFHTVRVQLSAESGVLQNRGKVWMWYTDDASHTLVQMRTRLFWGTLNIQLTHIDHEGGAAPSGSH